jgi:hypothetical protein
MQFRHREHQEERRLLFLDICIPRMSFVSRHLASNVILLFKIATGNLPFSENRHLFYISFKFDQGERPSRHPALTDNLWNLLDKCWQKNPDSRPYMDVVAEVVSLESLGLHIILSIQ